MQCKCNYYGKGDQWKASAWLAPPRPAPAATAGATVAAGAGQQHVALLRWLSRLFCINVIIVAAADAGSDADAGSGSGSGSAGCRYLKLIDS